LNIQYRQLQQTKAERNSMGRFQSKREIDARINNIEAAYKHSCDYFQHSYKITPNEAYSEIRRLEREYMSIVHNRDSADISHYHEKMRNFEKEYKRQQLLAQIRTDSKEIFERLDRADIRLNRITHDDYRKIAQELRPSQVALLEQQRYHQAKARGAYDFVR